MERLRRLWRRLRGHGDDDRIAREIDEELAFHLEMRTRENIAAGMTEGEARRRARARMGTLEDVRQRGRKIRSQRPPAVVRLWQDLAYDVRHAVRTMIATPTVSLTALLALALGIGASCAVFSVIDGVLLQAMPFADADRILVLRSDALREHYRTFESELDSIEAVGFFTVSSHLLTGVAEPRRVSGIPVGEGYFDVLGVTPQAGRTFADGDFAPDAAATVVISDRLWRTSLGADEAVIGRPLTLDDRPFVVIGVLPPGFRAPRYTRADVWVPLPQVESSGGLAVARLAPTATIERARVEIATLEAQLEVEPRDLRLPAPVTTLREHTVGDDRPALQMLAGAVALVVLIACANVANLLLARALARRREIAVRGALGATRSRIVRQLLTESGVLAITGGALGVVLAWAALPAILALSPVYLPRQENIAVDGRVLLFSAAVALASGLLFGLAPALFARGASPGASGERSAGQTRTSRRILDGLVVAEISLALVLIVGTGLLLRTFMTLNPTDPGFDPEGKAVFELRPPETRYPAAGDLAALYQRTVTELEGLPQVADAAAVTVVPFVQMAYVVDAVPEGHDPDADRLPRIWYERASADYLDLMAIPLLRGRPLEASRGGQPVAVVSEEAARTLWPDEDPLGKGLSVQIHDGARDYVVAGVAADTRRGGATLRPRPTVWVHFADHPPDHLTFVLQARGAPADLGAPVRGLMREIDADLPVENFRPLADILYDSVSLQRFYAVVLSTFGGIALLLAAIGFYGVMSFSVGRRQHEIGVRMALGAAPAALRRAVLRQGLVTASVGAVLGLAGALAFARLLEARIFGAQSLHLVDLAALTGGVIAVALAATYVPARRATRVDPLVTLRQQ